MKKLLFSFSIIFFLCFSVNGKPVIPDTNIAKPTQAQESSGIGSMLTTLAGGLKPSAFNKDWKTKSVSFLNRMKNQSNKDLTGSASALFEFAKYLKPDVFEDTWKTQKGEFLNGISEVKTTADLGRLFSLLLNNISPKFYTKEFKGQVDGLKMAVSKLGSN